MCFSDPPPPPPDMSEYTRATMGSAEEWSQRAQEQMDWAQQVGQQNQQTLSRVLDSTLGGAERFNQWAEQDRQRYDEVFQPREDKYLQQVDEYGSQAGMDREAGRRVADVAGKFDAARRNALQRLEGYGVDPSVARNSALDIGVRTQQAAAQAAGANNVRRERELTSLALQEGALQRGDIAAQRALQQGVAGGQLAGMGMSAANQTASTENQLRQGAIPMGQLEQQGYGQAADIVNQGYQNQLDQYDAESERNAGMLQGIGQLGALAAAPFTGGASLMALPGISGGGIASGSNPIATGDMGIGFGSNDPRYYADGGGVDQEFIPGHNSRALPFDQDGDVATGMGDGSGVDDTVPAYLSDGEYVIPADVVRKKGEEFFDKLVEKYHTPAAQQRGAQ